ncbi:MAG: tRNA (guanine(37)-N1)-methyltransferase Trm5b [Methanoregula sp. PtaU1.Bin051]|nr:MAG: tRNA (guanine(37)-N1)-methyltransferase Trm5b [Methanoregula sp. PtaU1.Bin051]
MSLRSDCEGIVPAPLLPLVPARFDVIGDIAVLSLPDALLPFAPAIARAIISRRKNIRTVVRKVSMVTGESRTARFGVLAGSGTETVHREYGFTYRLDIAKAFFAPRLGTERKRVSDQVRPGERVLVPFAGVGPFAIPAAAKGGAVTAVERNPEAFRYLAGNAAANGVSGRMALIMGDASDVSLLPEPAYDRAIIPAPYGQDRVLDVLAPVVRNGGMVHFYTFKKRHEIPALADHYAETGLPVQAVRRCGNVAPGVSRWAFDLWKDD